MRRTLSPFALALLALIASAAAHTAAGQEPEEVLKVNTRVVFLDALVTDKKTKSYASDLKAENFEVLADGRARQVSYFTREGDAARRPLALVLVFDLERIGAGRHLRRTDILEAMAKELERLPPGDEVAVLVLDPGGQEGRREWLTSFTRNRGQLASALSIIPTLVGRGGFGGDGGGEEGTSVTVSVGGGEKKAEVRSGDGTQDGTVTQTTLTAKNAEEMKVMLEDFDKHGAPELDEVDTVINRKGEKLTRTLKADGTLLVTKTKKDGTVETDVHGAFDLPRAIYEATKKAESERPNSQASIVYVTDGLAVMDFDERDFAEDRLIRRNVIFSALVADMKTGFKLAKPILAPLGNWAGIGIYGVSQHISKATGGDVVRVHGPNDYARGLSQIVGNLTARYSLGFTLADNEADDNQLHPLEVRVRAKDAKGKERKLEVKARRGFFMPTAPKRPEPKKPEAIAAPEAQTKN
jgi:VWFA-related protein